MMPKKILLYKDNEYNYPLSFGFVPHIHAYLHEDDDVARDSILIVPGGGYCFVAPLEGELVAKRFYKMGYNCFVLTYTTNPAMTHPLKMQPLNDISRAVRTIRRNAKLYGVTDSVILCGFSAGGHLCASLVVHHTDVHDSDKEYEFISNRPSAMILCYPAITTGRQAHHQSFYALLGRTPHCRLSNTEHHSKAEERLYMSAEKHVTSKTPPCFIWHTAKDSLVSPENSIMFAVQCAKNNVPYALHIFSDGEHGLSLADEQWARTDASQDDYTVEQERCLTRAIEVGLFKPNNKLKILLERYMESNSYARNYHNPPINEVECWPQLAGEWLKEL